MNCCWSFHYSSFHVPNKVDFRPLGNTCRTTSPITNAVTSSTHAGFKSSIRAINSESSENNQGNDKMHETINQQTSSFATPRRKLQQLRPIAVSRGTVEKIAETINMPCSWRKGGYNLLTGQRESLNRYERLLTQLYSLEAHRKR